MDDRLAAGSAAPGPGSPPPPRALANSEDELLELARGGDGPALERLLQRLQPRVLRFGLRMCRQDADAEDVLQETLLAAARSLHDFRGGSSLSTWLYTIARSFCIKQRRRSKFAPTAELSLTSRDGHEAFERADPAAGPDAAVAKLEFRQALEHALRELDPGQREVLLLRDVEGLTAVEVASVTSLSVEAVKSRLHRARLALRERLGPLLGRTAATPTPTCPDVFAAVERHLDGELTPTACADIERHLDGCSGCKEICDAFRKTLRVCQELPEPQVPPALQAKIREALRQVLAMSTVAATGTVTPLPPGTAAVAAIEMGTPLPPGEGQG